MERNALFKVISISQNTNSFGLYGVVIVERNGLAFEIGVSQINLPSKGNYITGMVTDNDDLKSLPFSYEIPRKLASPDKATLKEMFKDVAAKKGLTNVAKGKKIKTTIDFAKVFDKLDVNQKTEVIKNLERTLSTGISPMGLKIASNERAATEQLVRWCGVNLLVGNELCPPENLHQY